MTEIEKMQRYIERTRMKRADNYVMVYPEARELFHKAENEADSLHQRPDGTAQRNFNANRRRFIEGEDFFIVKPADIQMDEICPSEINNRRTVLLTKMGYLMLVKSFTDDLAWMVQRQLVWSYFEAEAPRRMLPAAEGGKKPQPRMRTLPKAVAELKEKDPDTCITLNALRRWVKSGKVPSKKAGKNFLVDLDEVGRYMGEG